jgi:hypothetical protein
MLRLGRLRCSFCTEIHRQPLRFSLSTSLEARAGVTSTTKVRNKQIYFLLSFLFTFDASLGMILRLSSSLLLSEKTPQQCFGSEFRPYSIFLGLVDPDPLVRDPDPDPAIIKQK